MAIEARLDAVGIIVADMGKALAFYRLLGAPVPADAEQAPHVEVVFPSGMRLLFDTEAVVRSFHAGWEPPTGAGRLGLAFAVDAPADVDALHAKATAAGHRSELDPFDAPWGQRYATLLDPDGNGVDLFAPLPS